MSIVIGKPLEKRITVIAGHYGSGKTEFAVHYALALAAEGKKTAIVDLDIANPYFRSRERQALLEAKGIRMYSNVYRLDITADLPAITAAIRSPLENPAVHAVVDAGGDGTGARVLVQFGKYFTPQQSEMLCVINANRPETRTLEGALTHMRAIEEESGIRITGLINNTHMLMETRAEDLLKGLRLCLRLSRQTGIPVVFTCCVKALEEEFSALLVREAASLDTGGRPIVVFPIDELKMRASWLDIPMGNVSEA